MVLATFLSIAALPLAACGGGGDTGSSAGGNASAGAAGAIERPSLRLGFIKLTDMAPLAIAVEKGFFAEEGLNVTLEPQANWRVLLDGVVGGQLDGAHMLAGQPIAASLGVGNQAALIAPISS
ncbi:MAG: ABC transporter substrate-binding protein, partial [Sphingomonadales bacterium]|nr:ABC transporter substrate-binding protein [Sphingomonadales bacterium]